MFVTAVCVLFLQTEMFGRIERAQSNQLKKLAPVLSRFCNGLHLRDRNRANLHTVVFALISRYIYIRQ